MQSARRIARLVTLNADDERLFLRIAAHMQDKQESVIADLLKVR